METRFLLEGYKRKDLAKALAGILETEVNYLGMPSIVSVKADPHSTSLVVVG